MAEPGLACPLQEVLTANVIAVSADSRAWGNE